MFTFGECNSLLEFLIFVTLNVVMLKMGELTLKVQVTLKSDLHIFPSACSPVCLLLNKMELNVDRKKNKSEFSNVFLGALSNTSAT